MRRIVFILMILMAAVRLHAQDLDESQADSLSRLYYTYSDRDTMRLNLSIRLAKGHYNTDSTIFWSGEALRHAVYHGDSYREAYALYYLAWGQYYQDQYADAMQNLYRCIYICDANNYVHLTGLAYRALGDCNCYLSDLEMSDSCYHMSLRIFYNEKDTVGIASTLYALALNYTQQNLYNESDSLFHEALNLCELSQDTYTASVCYQGLCDLYLRQYQIHLSDPDIFYLEKCKRYGLMADSLQLTEDDSYIKYRILDFVSSSLFYEAIANNYKGTRRREVLDSILMCYDKARRIDEYFAIGNEGNSIDIIYARYNLLSGYYDKCRHTLDSLMNLLDDDQVNDLAMYSTYEYYCACIGDHQGQLYFRSKYYEAINNRQTVDYAVKATKYQYQERFDALKEQDRHRQTLLTDGIILLGLVFIFTLIMLMRHRKHNRVLNCKNEEITLKNLQITDSMNYASRIQKAVLPGDRRLQQLFSDYFLIYKPLHIVAGDFYWAAEVSHYRILVCADCTGHGVPGAFVSMLGVSLLNEVCPHIVEEGGNAGDILDELRRRLKFSLGQTSLATVSPNQNMDGMDMSLVLIDNTDLKATYAGAYRPLWIYRDGQITKLNPDKMPIGVYIGSEHQFTSRDIQLRRGDILYMFTDGITDQLGYTSDAHSDAERYCTGRLLALVKELAPLPMPEQRARMESAMEQWKNGYKQIDDNLLIAVRI